MFLLKKEKRWNGGHPPPPPTKWKKHLFLTLPYTTSPIFKLQKSKMLRNLWLIQWSCLQASYLSCGNNADASHYGPLFRGSIHEQIILSNVKCNPKIWPPPKNAQLPPKKRPPCKKHHTQKTSSPKIADLPNNCPTPLKYTFKLKNEIKPDTKNETPTWTKLR